MKSNAVCGGTATHRQARRNHLDPWSRCSHPFLSWASSSRPPTVSEVRGPLTPSRIRVTPSRIRHRPEYCQRRRPGVARFPCIIWPTNHSTLTRRVEPEYADQLAFSRVLALPQSTAWHRYISFLCRSPLSPGKPISSQTASLMAQRES